MSLTMHWLSVVLLAASAMLMCMADSRATPPRAGEPADVAPSAYAYRADRAPDANPPEAWILLMQALKLPYTEPIGPTSPGVSSVLCGLLWEEVRPVRTIELRWPTAAPGRPPASDLIVSVLDASDDSAHTWWNPCSLRDCGKPSVSADGLTYTYAVPVDTWGIVVGMVGGKPARGHAVPQLRALVADTWKRARIEIEWGFAKGMQGADYSGGVSAYDAVLGPVRPIAGDAATKAGGRSGWVSPRGGAGHRRGVSMDVLYIGAGRWRKVWPYSAEACDSPRSLVTVQTKSGGFTFAVGDLEMGPIMAPEYGFFVRAVSGAKPDRSAGSALTVPSLRLFGSTPVPLGVVPKILALRDGDTLALFSPVAGG